MLEAREWYYFVFAPLMPMRINSEVLKKRTLLMCVILASKTVDVGHVLIKKCMP